MIILTIEPQPAGPTFARCALQGAHAGPNGLPMDTNIYIYIYNETKKRDKYLAIARSHHFIPVAVETSGAFGPEALELFDDIARRIRIVSQEVKSRAFLFQRISVALQQGNASAVLGTAPVDIYNEFLSF